MAIPKYQAIILSQKLSSISLETISILICNIFQMNNSPAQKTKIHYILKTKSLVLKPYCKKYVKEYHQWFTNDPELLYLTGSEPLSLQQQYENHQSWLQDPSKYTFLIFQQSTQNHPEIMIGDVNLFFSEYIEPNQCEINIMIALKQFRGRGYAQEVMEAIELFALGIYKKDTVIAKIKNDNVGSIKLFEKIGYEFVNESEHFQEKEYRKIMKIGEEEAQQRLKHLYQISHTQNTSELLQL